MYENEQISIAIIGAGISGLTTAKTLINKGYYPIIYESKGETNGMWTNDRSYESLITNISNHSCSFSDFPWKDEYYDYSTKDKLFPSKLDMNRYLNVYKQKYLSNDLIKLNHKVINISYSNNKFLLTYINDLNNQLEAIYDYVIITTGFFSKPTIPTSLTTTNRIIHSIDYKNPNKYKDKRVLVVGSSHSAIEISSELSYYTKALYLLLSKQIYVIPRYLPIDLSNKSSAMVPLDFLFYHLDDNKKQMVINSKESNIQLEQITKSIDERVGSHKYLESLCGNVVKHSNNKIDSSVDLTSYPIVAISDTFISNLRSNRIALLFGRLVDVLDSTVSINNNNTINELNDIDEIILCTGYQPSLNYLDNQLLDQLEYNVDDNYSPVQLYKEIFSPKVKNLFFVGMYRGQYMAVAELQAKYVCGLISGEINYPNDNEIANGMFESQSIRYDHPRPQLPHSDYVGMSFDLANAAHIDYHKNIIKFNRNKLQPLLPSYFNESNDSNELMSTYQYDLTTCLSGSRIATAIVERLVGVWQYSRDIRWYTDTSTNTGIAKFVNDIITNRLIYVDDYLYDPSLTNSLPILVQCEYVLNLSTNSIVCDDKIDTSMCLSFNPTENGWLSECLYRSNNYSMCVSFKGCYIDSIDIVISNSNNRIHTKYSRITNST